METTVLSLSDRYRSAIVFALAQQVPVSILCVLMLDLGQLARICGVTMIGFWAVVGWLMCRRPQAPTTGDIAFVRFGFVPLLVAAIELAELI